MKIYLEFLDTLLQIYLRSPNNSTRVKVRKKEFSAYENVYDDEVS